MVDESEGADSSALAWWVSAEAEFVSASMTRSSGHEGDGGGDKSNLVGTGSRLTVRLALSRVRLAKPCSRSAALRRLVGGGEEEELDERSESGREVCFRFTEGLSNQGW